LCIDGEVGVLDRVKAEISLLEGLPKQGDAYATGDGRHGWRNPIRADTGGLLTQHVVSSGPTRVLEIGTGEGLSTLYLASGLPSGAQLDTIELDEEVARATQERMDRLGVLVRVLHGDASEVIPTLKHRYDLVFFDAQKSLYGAHLLALIQRGLVGPGSVLLADNVIDRREECEDFLAFFEDNEIAHVIHETECGLLVATL